MLLDLRVGKHQPLLLKEGNRSKYRGLTQENNAERKRVP
jgi:hypothetical protein